VQTLADAIAAVGTLAVETFSALRNIFLGTRAEKKEGCLQLSLITVVIVVGVIGGIIAAAYTVVAFLIGLFF